MGGQLSSPHTPRIASASFRAVVVCLSVTLFVIAGCGPPSDHDTIIAADGTTVPTASIAVATASSTTLAPNTSFAPTSTTLSGTVKRVSTAGVILAGDPRSADVSDAGLTVVGFKDGSLQIWTSAGAMVDKISAAHPKSIEHVALNNAGDRFASASADGSVKLWKLGVDGHVQQQPLAARQLHAKKVGALAWSDADDALVTGSDDLTVGVWAVPSLDALASIRPKDLPASITDVSVPSTWRTADPSTFRVAVATDDRWLYVIDPLASTLEAPFFRATTNAPRLRFLADGTLVGSGADGPLRFTKLRDPDAPKPNWTYGVATYVAASKPTTGAELMVALTSDRTALSAPSSATAAAPVPDSVLVAWVDGPKNEPVRLGVLRGAATALALSPHGNFAAAVSEGKTLQVAGLTVGPA